MKKIISLSLSTMIILTSVGCSGGPVKGSTSSVLITESSSSIPTITESEEDSNTSETSNNWEIKYYVDEFSDQTDKKYASCSCIGSFSNTATTDSLLIARLLVDESVCIKLYEYGEDVVYNYYSKTAYYDITVKDDLGSISSFEGTIKSNNGDRIYVDESRELESLFKKSSQVKFHIVNRDRPTSVYNFTVDTKNFNDIYGKL